MGVADVSPREDAIDEEHLIVGGATFSEHVSPNHAGLKPELENNFNDGVKSTYHYHDLVNQRQDYKDNYRNQIKAYRNSNHSFSVS